MRTLDLEDESSIRYCKEGRLYRLALDYQLHQLQDLVIQKMQINDPIPFHNFLKIAEETYEKLEGQGVSFREQFKSQATREFKDNRDTVGQNWIAAAIMRGGHLAADLFVSLASNNKYIPPTEVQEGIPKLETTEPAIDSSSLQIGSSHSQKNLISKEDPCDLQSSPYPEELASCDAIREETRHDYRCRNCGYG